MVAPLLGGARPLPKVPPGWPPLYPPKSPATLSSLIGASFDRSPRRRSGAGEALPGGLSASAHSSRRRAPPAGAHADAANGRPSRSRLFEDSPSTTPTTAGTRRTGALGAKGSGGNGSRCRRGDSGRRCCGATPRAGGGRRSRRDRARRRSASAGHRPRPIRRRSSRRPETAPGPFAAPHLGRIYQAPRPLNPSRPPPVYVNEGRCNRPAARLPSGGVRRRPRGLGGAKAPTRQIALRPRSPSRPGPTSPRGGSVFRPPRRLSPDPASPPTRSAGRSPAAHAPRAGPAASRRRGSRRA